MNFSVEKLSKNLVKKRCWTSSIWGRGYKTFSVLNLTEYEILNAHTYESIKKFSIFQTPIGLECYFSCS